VSAQSAGATGQQSSTGPAGEPIDVPWASLEDYRCFGCSPHNPYGLQLRFWTHPDGVETAFRADRRFESYPGVVHGGLVSTVLDETMGNLLVLRADRPAFTVALRVRYLSPLSVETEYRCVARLRHNQQEPDLVHAAADVLDLDGAPMASATGVDQPVSMERARRHLVVSDDEAQMLTDSLAASARRSEPI